MRHGRLVLCGFVAVVALAGTTRADDKADRQTQQKELEKQQKADPFLEQKKFWEERRKRWEETEKQWQREIEAAKQAALKAKEEAGESAKKVEELTVRLNELRQGLQWQRPLHYYEKRPAPELLANLRGEVTEAADDLLLVDLGLGAGLAVGSEFDIFRLEGGGRLLGTGKVTSALNLFPKQAILTFTPVRDVPLDKLKAEELPKKGDQVRPRAEPKK